jgi:hypothetical protein
MIEQKIRSPRALRRENHQWPIFRESNECLRVIVRYSSPVPEVSVAWGEVSHHLVRHLQSLWLQVQSQERDSFPKHGLALLRTKVKETLRDFILSNGETLEKQTSSKRESPTVSKMEINEK